MTKHKVTVEEMDRCTADPVKRLEDKIAAWNSRQGGKDEEE